RLRPILTCAASVRGGHLPYPDMSASPGSPGETLGSMRLFIDCRYVRTQVHDGISRYTASLVQAAAAQAEITMLISDPAQLNLLPDLPWVLISSPTGPREPFVALQINRHHP